MVFTKAPILGTVKTRLQPELSMEFSAKLQALLTKLCLAQLTNLPQCDIVLYCSPTTQHPFFQQCLKQYNITLHPQAPGDLGNKLTQGFAEQLIAYQRVIAIGADCPPLDRNYILTAIKYLHSKQVVIGPAADGGYVLLGMSKPYLELFKNIAWGTATVYPATVNILQQNNINYKVLQTLWDVDRPGDLPQLKQYLATQKSVPYSKLTVNCLS